MQERDLSLSIAHLYPKLLNLYGDMGNIITLKNRCEWRGISVSVSQINIGDDVSGYDLYFIGGGQDKQQEEVASELYSNKDKLTIERDKGAVFLGICGGYQLFGHYYQPHDKEKLLGISLMDAYTVAGKKRFIGNVTVETDFLNPKTLVGFENHSGLTYLQGETKPIGIVKVGAGNNGVDKTAGGRYKNVFGTYLHGSLLPKNPHFADYLIELALEKKYGEHFTLSKLDDKLENETHNSLILKSY
ncbi:MAG: glutamine amidotransferase [Clostridiaceae bacterium]|jgi:lipid II isoglutaminyl synthase (glutamine-hydrolysing)|nr:glutamine amidotransferase [Clostridiaceae bacterium]